MPANVAHNNHDGRCHAGGLSHRYLNDDTVHEVSVSTWNWMWSGQGAGCVYYRTCKPTATSENYSLFPTVPKVGGGCIIAITVSQPSPSSIRAGASVLVDRIFLR